MGLAFQNTFYINSTPTTSGGGGGSSDLQPYENICDKILGSSEQYETNKNNIIDISEMCDDIIGKSNTSSIYEDVEFDTLDELELIADTIIGE